jgi:hypothetical protein
MVILEKEKQATRNSNRRKNEIRDSSSLPQSSNACKIYFCFVRI